MGWASKGGHAYADSSNPEAWGVCDRCGQTWLLRELKFQFDFRGPRLMNTQLRVCQPCTDLPCVWFKPIVVPPDPIPVPNPRPQQTNTGPAGWSMGAGWSVGPWSVGSNSVGPTTVIEQAPPMTTLPVDEE